LRNGKNIIRMTVKTSTVKGELTCTDPNPDEYSWCTVPRDYTGQFTKLYAGFKAPCRLRNTKWECQVDANCSTHGAPGGGTPRYDNVALYGGQAYAAPGACCFDNTTCVEAYGQDCDVLGGHFQGDGTSCATTVCCPAFLPDHDMDNDVDLSDFGRFQTCLGGRYVPYVDPACKCVDLDGDSDVDVDDLAKFLGCLTGPEIAVNPNCMN
jgi:hypothetical protein